MIDGYFNMLVSIIEICTKIGKERKKSCFLYNLVVIVAYHLNIFENHYSKKKKRMGSLTGLIGLLLVTE